MLSEVLGLVGGVLTGGVVSGLWMRWSLNVKYREIEKLRQVLFTQLLYEYDKKIEIEELLEEVDEWLEEYKPSKVFSFKNIREEEKKCEKCKKSE
tara:strand:- start:2153 stop:2437 length:285 start_codon:yes stop_codon:yes gene_type:complete